MNTIKKEFTGTDLVQRYEEMTASVQVDCMLASDLIGGQPASQNNGIENFVQYQMGVEPNTKAFTEAVERILMHEIGPSRTVTMPDNAILELEEVQEKSVNVIRRDKHGPWLGDWMIKACIKNGASRIGLWNDKKGTKGDMAEMGRVRAQGVSKIGNPADFDRFEKIYLRTPDGEHPAPTQMQFFQGKVSTPKGFQSIQTLSEACIAPARFSFEYRFFNGSITDEDALHCFAAAMIAGVGSCRSLERGKFIIEKLILERPEKAYRVERKITEKETKEAIAKGANEPSPEEKAEVTKRRKHAAA